MQRGHGRVLVTGCRGLIGREVLRRLVSAGWDAWGLARGNSGGSGASETEGRVLTVDLLDPEAAGRVVGDLKPRVVVHAAALAHGQDPGQGETVTSVNVRMTRNLLAACRRPLPVWILLSSVAVYGEADRHGPILPSAELRPASDYGRSKVECERAILASGVEHCHFLRLTPVYDASHLADVRKRAFLPGPLPLRIRIRPAPRYSLCHLETAAAAVLRAVEDSRGGRVVANVADPEPYGQGDLVDWFSGPVLPLPSALARPADLLLRLVPGSRSYHLRCLLWRLLHDNIYPPTRGSELESGLETRA